MLPESKLIAAAIIAASYNHNRSTNQPNLPVDQMQKMYVQALAIVHQGYADYLAAK